MADALDDATPVLTRDARSWRWDGVVDCAGERVAVETGFPLSDPDAESKTLASVLRLQHLASMNDPALIRWARKDRHKR